MSKTGFFLLAMLAGSVAAADEARPGLIPASDLVAAARAQVVHIDAAALADKLADARVLVDVREPYEYAAGHIAGAVNIPRGRLEFDILEHAALAWIRDADPDALTDTEIIVYCRTGGRAALAAQSLQSLGFRAVRSLEGGIDGWRAAGLPVEH